MSDLFGFQVPPELETPPQTVVVDGKVFTVATIRECERQLRAVEHKGDLTLAMHQHPEPASIPSIDSRQQRRARERAEKLQQLSLNRGLSRKERRSRVLA